MSKRLLWCDSLRGMLIILVIIGHCIQDIHKDYLHDYIWNLIYSFHMPAFMALSGYVGYKEKYNLNIVKRRAIELLLPFFVWTVLVHISDTNFLKSIYNIFLHPDISFWFLWVLFFIIFLFYLADLLSDFLKIKKEYVIISFCVLLTSLMIVFDIRLFGFQFIAYYFLYYSLGYYLRKNSEKFNINSGGVIGLLFIIWFGLASFWHMHELPFFLKKIKIIPSALMQYSYRIIVATLAIILLISFFRKYIITDNIINNNLAYLGRLTLGIYVIHLSIPYEKIIGEFSFLYENVIVFFLIRLASSIIIIKIINSFDLLNLLLLGNTVNKK